MSRFQIGGWKSQSKLALKMSPVQWQYHWFLRNVPLFNRLNMETFFFFLTFLMFLCLTMIFKILLPVWWVKLNNIRRQGLVNVGTYEITLKGQEESDTCNEKYFRSDSCPFLYKHLQWMGLLSVASHMVREACPNIYLFTNVTLVEF